MDQNYANASNKAAAPPLQPQQTVSDVLQNTLNMLCDVEGYVETIKVRLYGPRPAEVAQGSALNQPHLRQSAEMVRDRVGSLVHELREISNTL